jgi:hypothetical protein
VELLSFISENPALDQTGISQSVTVSAGTVSPIDRDPGAVVRGFIHSPAIICIDNFHHWDARLDVEYILSGL